MFLKKNTMLNLFTLYLLKYSGACLVDAVFKRRRRSKRSLGGIVNAVAEIFGGSL